MKAPVPLNLPKAPVEKAEAGDQFEAVSFVNEMNQHQLKVFIKRMWLNLQALASMVDETIPEVANAIDALLDGNKIPSDIRDRYQFFNVGDAIIEYDSKTKQVRVMSKSKHSVTDSVDAMSFKELQTTMKGCQ